MRRSRKARSKGGRMSSTSVARKHPRSKQRGAEGRTRGARPAGLRTHSSLAPPLAGLCLGCQRSVRPARRTCR